MATTSPAVELILARLRESGDFPAMAKTVGSVSTLTSSEDTSISALADTVLQDYGLAQKLLRLVNTVAYAQHGQVTTVSRAVLLMGFDRVRSVALGLMIFEKLQAEAKTPALLDALNMSFYSAILGRSIAGQTALADKEETFITALFHNLGRTLVALYLPAEAKAIHSEGAQHQDFAVLKVLGMSYSSIGVSVARALNLPEKLLQSMNRVTGAQSHASMTDEEKLAALATLSNGVADALATSASPKVKKQAIDRLVKSYGAPFKGLDGKTMDTLIAGAETELHEHSKTFKLNLEGSSFATGLSEFKADALVSASVGHISSVSAAGGLVDVGADLPTEDIPPEALLTQGLHEVTSLLVTEFTLDDVLRVILETIYRALGVSRTRAFFLLKDAALPKARFRFGMGQSPADMRTWMEVPLKGTQDLFVLALNQARDLVIKDLRSPDLDPLIPEWYRATTLERRYAVLLPLVVNHKSVGLFYVDGDEAGAALLTATVLNNLKVLRSQAVLAIHQSTLRSAARKR
ncbi:MAG TPA: HDOD domain-containing protein [Gemmatimonadaceae bacterium]|nr:HDOD domain-containing protein [Gemmatimonadaceae bacterium]